MQKKMILKFFQIVPFLLLSLACEEKVSEGDIESYKNIMDIRLGHLGNALIIQGRLLDAYNLRSESAEENHFKEAEELIKENLEKFGRPDDLEKLRIPNSTKIRQIHNSLIESSQLLVTALNMLEDQAWLGGSVSYAESAVDKARFSFQTAVQFIYKTDDQNIKPIQEPKEYDVGDIPDKLLE